MSNKKILKIIKKTSTVSMGIHSSYIYHNNPKQLLFSLSRYKFVSKMFENFNDVAEVGAGDGFQSEIVRSSVKNIFLFDIETSCKNDYEIKNKNPAPFIIHDFTKKKYNKKFDGIYSIDVLEHVPKNKEKLFIRNIKSSLKKNGSLIIGTPSLESQKYASPISKLGHVNCKKKVDLKKFLKNHFNNVYVFSMNDEVVHTGFDSMSNFNWAICN